MHDYTTARRSERREQRRQRRPHEQNLGRTQCLEAIAGNLVSLQQG